MLSIVAAIAMSFFHLIYQRSFLNAKQVCSLFNVFLTCLQRFHSNEMNDFRFVCEIFENVDSGIVESVKWLQSETLVNDKMSQLPMYCIKHILKFDLNPHKDS